MAFWNTAADVLVGGGDAITFGGVSKVGRGFGSLAGGAADKLGDLLGGGGNQVDPYQPGRGSFNYRGTGEGEFSGRAGAAQTRAAPGYEQQRALGELRAYDPRAAAQAQLKLGQEANMRQSLAMARSGPGGAAGQTAALNAAMANQATAGNQINAQAAAAAEQAKLQQLGMQGSLAGQIAGTELQSRGLNDQYALGLYGLGQKASLADLQGRMGYEQLMSQNQMAGLLANQQAAQQNKAGIWNLVGSVAGGLLGSDPRAKTEIQPVGQPEIRAAGSGQPEIRAAGGVQVPQVAPPPLEEQRRDERVRMQAQEDALEQSQAKEERQGRSDTTRMVLSQLGQGMSGGTDYAKDFLTRYEVPDLIGSGIDMKRDVTPVERAYAPEQVAGDRFEQQPPPGNQGALAKAAAAQGSYSYRYKPEFAAREGVSAEQRQVGPMADEMAQNPAYASSVRQGPDGMLRVDAGRAALANVAVTSDLAREQERLKTELDEIRSRNVGALESDVRPASTGRSVPAGQQAAALQRMGNSVVERLESDIRSGSGRSEPASAKITPKRQKALEKAVQSRARKQEAAQPRFSSEGTIRDAAEDEALRARDRSFIADHPELYYGRSGPGGRQRYFESVTRPTPAETQDDFQSDKDRQMADSGEFTLRDRDPLPLEYWQRGSEGREIEESLPRNQRTTVGGKLNQLAADIKQNDEISRKAAAKLADTARSNLDIYFRHRENPSSYPLGDREEAAMRALPTDEQIGKVPLRFRSAGGPGREASAYMTAAEEARRWQVRAAANAISGVGAGPDPDPRQVADALQERGVKIDVKEVEQILARNELDIEEYRERKEKDRQSRRAGVWISDEERAGLLNPAQRRKTGRPERVRREIVREVEQKAEDKQSRRAGVWISDEERAELLGKPKAKKPSSKQRQKPKRPERARREVMEL
jgi:hypothetical protein